jgi:DNA end-binding protein Ku
MRSIWKGTIGFGLVNIPVKLYTAVTDNGLNLDLLDSRDHSRIRYQRVNEKTRREVPYEKIVKGYGINGSYVILEEKDFEDASPKKTKMIELESFITLADIDPIYYETSYYSEPEVQGKKAYVLLLKALQRSKKAGLARFVLRNSENLCILHPVKNVIAITKIRFFDEIRSTEDLQVSDDIAISKKELDMGIALIDQYTGAFDIRTFKDEYHTELLNIIKAKAKGKRPAIKKLKAQKSAGSDLYEQLILSLGRKGA